MENLGNLLKTLTKDNTQVYSKIVKVLEKNDTETALYQTEINGELINMVDVQPVDGTPIVYGVRLSTDNSNYTVPTIGSYAIIIFINNYDAIITQISNAEYTRQEITKVDGTTEVIYETYIENNNSVFKLNSDNINMNTSNGGNFSIDGNNVLISNVTQLKFQIVDNGNVINEITLNKDNGISLISYNNTPISIKNNTTSLKDVLFDMIDKFTNATYISVPAGTTATVTPLTVTALNDLKVNIATLLK